MMQIGYEWYLRHGTMLMYDEAINTNKGPWPISSTQQQGAMAQTAVMSTDKHVCVGLSKTGLTPES